MSDIMKKEEQSTAIQVSDYGTDASAGFENQTAADRSIPFLGILQDLSPIVKPRDPAYIKGAEAGMLLITAMNRIISGEKGIVFIPVLTEHVFSEWKPNRGGYVGRHAIDAPIVLKAQGKAKDRKLKTDDDNDLTETFYVYGLGFEPKVDLTKERPTSVAEIIDLNDEGIPMIAPFVSTKITPYKRINTQISMFKLPGIPFPHNQPPLWAFALWLRTKLESRDSGDSFNYLIEPAPAGNIEQSKLVPRFRAPGEEWPAYRAAKQFYEAIRGNKVKVDFSRSESGGDSSGAKSGFANKTEEDIPF
jgi:hypothetical protein